MLASNWLAAAAQLQLESFRNEARKLKEGRDVSLNIEWCRLRIWRGHWGWLTNQDPTTGPYWESVIAIYNGNSGISKLIRCASCEVQLGFTEEASFHSRAGLDNCSVRATSSALVSAPFRKHRVLRVTSLYTVLLALLVLFYLKYFNNFPAILFFIQTEQRMSRDERPLFNTISANWSCLRASMSNSLLDIE